MMVASSPSMVVVSLVPLHEVAVTGFHLPVVKTVVDTKNCTHSIYTFDLSTPMLF